MTGLIRGKVPAAIRGAGTDSVHRRTRHYESPGGMWAVRWGRNVYERAIRELVAEINSECLEFVRLYKKDDLTPSEEHSFDTKNWSCG